MSESRTCRGHKGASDPSELELERAVSCPMRMLEFELRSSAREPREKPSGVTPGRGKT